MIPITLTTVTISRIPADPTRDGYDTAPSTTTVATGVRAVIGNPAGSQQLAGGDRTIVRFTLRTDPTDLQADDIVTDEQTGAAYRAIWARTRNGFGLDHTEADLEQVTGDV